MTITAAQQAAVAALLGQPTLTRRVRERAEMVKAAALGYEVGAIAAWSGRSVRRVRHWLARFAELGSQDWRMGRAVAGRRRRTPPIGRRRRANWSGPSTSGPPTG